MLQSYMVTIGICTCIAAGSCDAGPPQPEPQLGYPSRDELALGDLRLEVYDIANKLEELQALQAILIEDLGQQKRPIERQLLDRLKNNSGITLQWIESDARGNVSVTESENGKVVVRGEQVSDDGRDKLLVEGQVILMTSDVFIVQGSIDFDVQKLRESGAPRCHREGFFTFRITGDRKYWRLLEKDGHCGQTTDYIDIYL